MKSREVVTGVPSITVTILGVPQHVVLERPLGAFLVRGAPRVCPVNERIVRWQHWFGGIRPVLPGNPVRSAGGVSTAASEVAAGCGVADALQTFSADWLSLLILDRSELKTSCYAE